MLNWISYTFGNFFSHKLSKQGCNKSFLNVFFQLVTYILIMTALLSLGYNLSFKTHYNNASQFQEFLYDISTKHDVNISLKDSENNKIAAYFNTDETDLVLINTFENESDAKYKKHDYNLIIDTRDSASTFVAFEVKYFNINDEKDIISADEYRALEQGSSYAGQVTIKNEVVNITDDMITMQESWLKDYIPTLDEQHQFVTLYGELLNLDKNGVDYKNKVYSLYTQAYYSLSLAPNIQTYYQYTYAVLNESNEYKYANYVILTDTWALVSFTNDKGINITYDGYFTTLDDNFTVFTLQTNTDEIIKSNLDLFVNSVFVSVSMVKALYTGTTLFRFYPFILIALAILAMLANFAAKSKNREYCDTWTKGLKLSANYLFISSVIAGLIGLILSFIVRQDLAFTIATWSSIAIVGIRTIVFVIMEELECRKQDINNPKQDDDDDNDDDDIIINDNSNEKVVSIDDDDEFKMKKI